MAVLKKALSCQPDQSPDACAGLNNAAEAALPKVITTNDAATVQASSNDDHVIIAAVRQVAAVLNNGNNPGVQYSNEDILKEMEAYKAERAGEVGVAVFGFFEFLWGLVSRLFGRRG